MSRSIRVSSNMTMGLTLFFSTITLIFVGLTAVAILFGDIYSVPFPTLPFARFMFLGIFILYYFLLRMTLLRLKRVEMSDNQLFVTNYFKTYSYLYSDIKEVKLYDLLIVKIWVVTLKYKGKFGRKIPFILNKVQMDYVLGEMGLSSFTEVPNLQTDK